MDRFRNQGISCIVHLIRTTVTQNLKQFKVIPQEHRSSLLSVINSRLTPCSFSENGREVSQPNPQTRSQSHRSSAYHPSSTFTACQARTLMLRYITLVGWFCSRNVRFLSSNFSLSQYYCGGGFHMQKTIHSLSFKFCYTISFLVG